MKLAKSRKSLRNVLTPARKVAGGQFKGSSKWLHQARNLSATIPSRCAPQQKDGTSCGVYACVIALSLRVFGRAPRSIDPGAAYTKLSSLLTKPARSSIGHGVEYDETIDKRARRHLTSNPPGHRSTPDLLPGLLASQFDFGALVRQPAFVDPTTAKLFSTVTLARPYWQVTPRLDQSKSQPFRGKGER